MVFGSLPARLAVTGLLVTGCGSSNSANTKDAKKDLLPGVPDNATPSPAPASPAPAAAPAAAPAPAPAPAPGHAPVQPPGLPPADGSLVVKGCFDGDYTEDMPDPTASITDLLTSYTKASAYDFTQGVLKRRYPFGFSTVDLMASDPQCSRFKSDIGVTAFDDLAQQTTTVHECGHLLDNATDQKVGFSYYKINAKLNLQCPGGTSVGRGAILADKWSSKRPPCPAGDQTSDNCDGYADPYLTTIGDEGFNFLMEEYTQYINSLAVAYVIYDQWPPGHGESDRDGLATEMWWMERYLQFTREQHPDEYEAIVGNACWQQLILTQWARAWLYMNLTKDETGLDLHATSQILPLVMEPSLLGELQLVRKRTGCVK